MTFDIRTRVDGCERRIDPAVFFEQTLPQAFRRANAWLSTSLRYRPPVPLTVQVEGEAWTMRVAGNSIAIDRGGMRGAQCICLRAEQIAALAFDLVTPNGWATEGSLISTASLKDLFDWWILLRGALDGIRPFVPGSISILDAHGAPLQLERSFTLRDSPEEMHHFLGQAGYLHLRDVFSRPEMAAVSKDFDRYAKNYAPEDRRSYWGRSKSGELRLVRMQYFDTVSERAASLMADERIHFIAAIPGDGHELNREAGLVEALIKPVGMLGVLSDFPWHKDCSLGRHSYECCSLTLCVYVTPADTRRGMLRMMAGSHRALIWPVMQQPEVDLPVIDLPAAAGDVTMHLSCTMHMSRAPIEVGRRTLYIGYRLPERNHEIAGDARRQTGLRTTDLLSRQRVMKGFNSKPEI